MDELEAKVRIFEAIANNSKSMCESGFYFSPSGAARAANEVYEILMEDSE